MEARRSLGGRLQRKPLADCSNIVTRTSQQSSSSSATLVKFANPSLTSSLKRLVDETTLKQKSEDVNISKAGGGNSSRSLSTRVRPVTRRVTADLVFPSSKPSLPSKSEDVNNSKASAGNAFRSVSPSIRLVTSRISADLGFPATEPSRPQKSRSNQGVGDKKVIEPYSVDAVRRKAFGIKRNKDASSSGAMGRIRLDLVSSSGKKTHRANESKPKPSKVAPKKRQRMVKNNDNNLAHGVSQDYIEQQRAYFAEVDAFELPEEEVSSSDLD